MTRTAAAIHTLRTPRRRTPGPAAWERAGAISGVLAATALVVGTCILASTPSVDAVPEAVRNHLVAHYPIMMTSAYTIAVAALLLVPFFASLRTFITRRTDVAECRSTVTLVAGAVGIAMLALAGGLLATATVLAHRSTAGPAVFAVFVAAKLIATLALLPIAAVVLANARTIATRQGRPERWLIRFDIECAAFAVVASIASFVDRAWIAPGGLVAAGAWLLIALWVVALAKTIGRGDRASSLEEDS